MFELLALINPPVYLLFGVFYLTRFSAFLALPAGLGLFAAGASYCIWWYGFRKLKDFSYSVAAIGGLFTAILTANWWSEFSQDRALAEFQPQCVERFSFWHSLRIRGEEFQFSGHLYAYKDGEEFGWSFREMKLYKLPDDVYVDPIESCIQKYGPYSQAKTDHAA